MQFTNLNRQCYLDKKFKVIKFIPEKHIENMPFDEKLWDRIFIKKKGIIIKDLQLSNIGKYSIAKKDVTEKLHEVIKYVYKLIPPKMRKSIKELVITECNGGLGGVTIGIAPYFKKINTVEITEDHAKIINNNLNVYGIKNVSVINDDYFNVMFTLKQDIIFADPPWGGPNYKSEKDLHLGLNNVDIVCIINELYKKKLFQIFILLAPYNFALSHFTNNIISDMYIIKKYRSHYLILILNF